MSCSHLRAWPSLEDHLAGGSPRGCRTKDLIQNDRCRRGWRWISSALYNLISEVTHHYFCCILFIRSWSLGPAHTQKESNSAPSLEERYIKDSVDCSETATMHTLATRYLCFSHMQNMLMPSKGHQKFHQNEIQEIAIWIRPRCGWNSSGTVPNMQTCDLER